MKTRAINRQAKRSGSARIRLTKPAPSLRELVRRITAANRHPEIDWGVPAENERW